MADKKISQLSPASTPLAGSEVLPIVQSGSTVKVSVDNLTAGKSVSATSFVPTGSTVPTNGMFLSSANSVGIASNSTEHWVVNASGNFNPVGSKGIGTNAAPVSEAVATTFSTSAAAAGSNLSGNTLAADGTDTNIDINITPKGTGEVNLPKVDIDAGAIDGTPIGANSASTGAFTTITASSTIKQTGATQNFTNLTTSDQEWNIDATETVVVTLTSVDGQKVQFILAMSFDNSNLNVRATNLSGATVGTSGVSATVQPGDGRTYTINRDPGTGKYRWQASSLATGTTSIRYFLLGNY